MVAVGRDVRVSIPSDARLRFIIDTMAVYVLRDGCAFEQLMMTEQQVRGLGAGREQSVCRLKWGTAQVCVAMLLDSLHLTPAQLMMTEWADRWACA